VLRRRLELEAARPALAGQHRPQRLDGLAHAGERLLERHPVPALDDHVRGGAQPEHEAPAAGVGQRGGVLGQHGRAARERVHDARAEPHALGPGRGERQRREAVRAGGLAGPEVLVPARLRLAHERLVVGQAQPRERQCEGPARLGHAGTL
jgi:hypothetical protein